MEAVLYLWCPGPQFSGVLSLCVAWGIMQAARLKYHCSSQAELDLGMNRQVSFLPNTAPVKVGNMLTTH